MNTTPLHNFKFSRKHIYRTCLTLYVTKKCPLTLQLINHKTYSYYYQADTVHRMEKNHYKELKLLTWYRIDTTAPQISSPTMNCSPSIARTKFSQQRDAKPFLSRKINFPPF